MTLDWRSLPPILTADEAAIVVLRLDADDAEPVPAPVLRKRLQRLVDSRQIRPVRIGKCNRLLRSAKSEAAP